MGRKSKIESSDHFNDILDMIKEGLKPSDIHNLLLNEFNEDISERTIRRYIGQLKSKTNQEYYKRKKAKEAEIVSDPKNDKTKKVNEVVDKGLANKEAVDSVIAKGVFERESLDIIIAAGKNLNLDVSGIKEEFGPQGGVVVSKLDVLKANALVANVVIKATKVRADILKDEPEPPDINIFNLNGFDEDEQRDIKKLAQSLAKSDIVE